MAATTHFKSSRFFVSPCIRGCVGPKASLDGCRTSIYLYLNVCILMDIGSYQAFSFYTDWCHQQSLEQFSYMISRSKTSMMTSAAVQSALPTIPDVWSNFNRHQPNISCIGSLVMTFFLTSLQNDCGLSFGWSWDWTKKTFSNVILLQYHPIFCHFMDGTFSHFLLIVAFTGADLSTISWIHSLSTEMVERLLLNEIVLHYVLWPTILPLWCSFITAI